MACAQEAGSSREDWSVWVGLGADRHTLQGGRRHALRGVGPWCSSSAQPRRWHPSRLQVRSQGWGQACHRYPAGLAEMAFAPGPSDTTLFWPWSCSPPPGSPEQGCRRTPKTGHGPLWERACLVAGLEFLLPGACLGPGAQEVLQVLSRHGIGTERTCLQAPSKAGPPTPLPEPATAPGKGGGAGGLLGAPSGHLQRPGHPVAPSQLILET